MSERFNMTEDNSELTSLMTTNEVECKVLVIYTGGTIGMISKHHGGLVPSKQKLENLLTESTLFNDRQYKNHATGFLSLPNPLKRKILYKIHQYEELIDSSNINFDHWTQIATDVFENYYLYDGFVILHGTDTLAYTASALSFICENLGKPIILTGSQVPLFELMSDGRDNFICSLLLAGEYNIPEVTIFFNHKLYRGNRVSKSSSMDYEAFDSFNHPPLAAVGVNISVDYRSILMPSTLEAFRVHKGLNKNVGLLRIHPSITADIIKCYMEQPMKGVVIQSYGAGNMPTDRKDIMDQIKKAIQNDILIVNCTQCFKGTVSTLYETGKVMSEIGVIPGGDMTPEAALTKLAYVLSKEEWDSETRKKMMLENIRGELTVPKDRIAHNEDMMEAIARSLRLVSPQERDELEIAIFPSLLFSAVENDSVDKIKTYLNHGANINVKNFDSRTPLHLACCVGNLDVVEFLLLHGASVHAKDRYGQTPLMDAVRYGHEKIVLLLIKNGAHLAGSDWRNKGTKQTNGRQS